MERFNENVYGLLKKVPKGWVTTYKELANAMGTTAYRAVGQAMRNNPYAPEVPCHRCVSSDGTIGGFGGETSGMKVQEKIEMLKSEGIEVEGNKVKNFEKVLFRF